MKNADNGTGWAPVELPGRGCLSVRDTPGPPGAPTLVLLHGWTASADINFGQLYGPLTQRWRVVAFDHRGHGRGLRCPGPFRLEDCADDAVAVLDALGIDDAVVLGYSMGGAVALLTWARHRARVRGLVLCATSSAFVDGVREALLYRLLVAAADSTSSLPPPVLRGLVARVCAAKSRGHPAPGWLFDELARHHWPTVLEAGRALGRFRGDEWLAEVDVPTAVVVMLNDAVLPAARQLHLARGIPNCTVHTVRGGHDACLAAPELLLPALREACESVRRRSVARHELEAQTSR